MGSRPGTLFIVATPIGNLEDITIRALRVLREASVIAAEDTRRTAQLLTRYAISTPLTSLHEHNEGLKTPSIIDRLRRGENVALVSDAGTPTVSDPGGHLIRTAIDAAMKVEVVPGPSAVTAALAASGFGTASFSFLGFPPTKSKDRAAWFSQLIKSGGVVVFFESPHRFRSTIEELSRLAPECRICVARELTKAHEELVIGPINEALAQMKSLRGEFTIVADLGHKTELPPAQSPGDASIATEFGDMTINHGLSRREAIRQLARKYSLPSRGIYSAIEAAKKSGK